MAGEPAAALDSTNTIPRALVRQAEKYGDKALIAFPREAAVLTYQDLAGQAMAAAARLLRDAHGLRAGDMAAIYLGNCMDNVRAWFSCLFGGLVDVPVNHEFRKSLLLFALTTVQAKVVFTDADGISNLADAEVRDYLGQLKLIVLCGRYERQAAADALAGIPGAPRVVELAELTSPGPSADAWRNIDATAAALIRFTSGTTGSAKGVLQSHLHVLGKSAVHNRILGYEDQDVLYTPFPLHHNLASINGLIGTLQAGGTMVSVPRFSATRYWEDIRRCGATLAHLLHPLAPLVSAQPPSEDDRRHNVRTLWTGGPDPRFEERFNVAWVRTYALGEVGAVSYKHGGGAYGDTGAGRLLPEMDVRIVDEMDRPVPAGAHGEITIHPRHPHRVMLAYHNNLAATMRAFRNLWFHTGDAGFLSEDGELHFLGRIGDTIRRRGVNISSDQIEEELRRHANVLDCGVIAVQAPAGDQEIHACILWKQAPGDLAAAYEELAEFLAGRLPRGYAPRYFETVDDLPRTHTGKVQKAALRNRAQFGPTWDREETSSNR